MYSGGGENIFVMCVLWFDGTVDIHTFSFKSLSLSLSFFLSLSLSLSLSHSPRGLSPSCQWKPEISWNKNNNRKNVLKHRG